MTLRINGKVLTLSDRDFRCKGGEANLYIKDKIAYKVCHDPSIMIPEAKVHELQALSSPLIVRPIDLIFNDKILIGFTMNALDADCTVLVKFFTNTFRDANGVTNDHIIQLTENIKNETHAIHSKNILIVDGNELNYMVAKDFVTPYFIDVNCWQTPHFPATAIMPSIRDYATKGFSVLTDWFSFAVISFQLFIGIHPFKGTAPGFSKKDLPGRIKANMSVLNPKVLVPDAARDFSLIPSSYMDWYFNLFEKGKRIPPPALPGTAGKTQVKIILVQSTNSFEISELKEYKEKIIFYANFFSNKIVKTKKRLFINNTDYLVSDDVEFLYAMPEMIPMFVKIEDEHIQFKSLDPAYTVKEINIKCKQKMIINNTLFLKNQEKLIEIGFDVFGKVIIPSSRNIWQVEHLSSEMFSGVVTQSVLGKAFLVIPSEGKCKTIKTPELDDYKIIEAKHDNGVCVVVGHKDSYYDKLIFKINSDSKYVVREIKDVDYLPINFVTLDNGVCVMINEDDSVEVFLNRIDKDDVKRIEDPDIHSTMRLAKDGIKTLFYKGNKLFSITTKKN